MAFNHYAKIKRILENYDTGWYVVRIKRPTSAKTFKGEVRTFDHYYRVFSAEGVAIPYCKFQQMDKFLSVMGLTEAEFPLIDE